MAQDIMLNDKYELRIANGDFVIDESTAQHEKLLIGSHKGEWRQAPTCGVGIQRYINDEAPGDLVTSIKTELKSDGMTVNSVRINPDTGKIEIDAEYE